ncbi:AsmA-like C-terminal region-containing protein [Aureimonas sp. ME7]|uniref:AsmA family protein n=1 Tax=Aureimonas sp. ME7 TaxID=2744252 RepID=UPI0015F43A87|nr:AsmA-like C-terminal region-containing protein [Aureimonas sp. ME7]
MKLFIALGSLLILALVALLIGPRFVDWTSYRSSFEREASRILGQRVEVRGQASARLLPFPSLSFTDVVVGDDPADPVLQIGGFRMDAELAPYLSGEIRIFHMRLDGPALSVPVGADGSIRWPIGAGSAPPSETVVLERIEIAGGSALFLDRRSGRSLALSRIDGNLSAQSLRGPFNGTATLEANGEPLAASLTTGTGAGEGKLAFRLTLDSQRIDARASLDAIASSLPGEPLVEGALSVLSPIDPAAKPDQARTSILPPLRLATKLTVTPSSVAAADLRAEVGGRDTPYVATGSALIDVGSIPRFDLALEGQAIDVDEVAPPQPTEASGPSLADRIEAVRLALERLPSPRMPGRVRLALPLVTFGDTPVRNVSLAGSPAGDGWSLQSLSAELPGRTLVEASGVVRTDEAPGFRGSLLVAVRQPAAFLGWAGGAADPALAALPRAGFSAKVALSASDQSFEDLEVDLGGQTLAGSIRRTVRPEGRASAVDLRGDAVDLGPVMALARMVAARGAQAEANERFDVQFSTGPARFGDFSADGIDMDFSLDRNLVDLAGFDARNFAGADIHAEGTLADPFGFPRPDLSLEVSAEAPEQLASFLRRRLPQSPLAEALEARARAMGPLSLSGTAVSTGANRADLTLDLTGQAAGTDLALRLALQNGLEAATANGRFGLDLTLAQNDATVLLEQFGLSTLPVGEEEPLSAVLSASGVPNEPIAVSAKLRSTDAELSAEGTATLGGQGVESADLDLALRGGDLSPWLTRLAVAAGQPADGLPAELSGRLSWRGASWSLGGVTGLVAGSRLGADLHAEAGAPVSGTLDLADLSLDWLATVVTGTDASGAIDAAAAPFAATLLPSRAYRVSLAAERATGLGLTLSNLRAAVDGEGPRLSASSLSATLPDGASLGASGELRNVSGFLSTELDLALREQPIPAGNGVLQGQLSATANLRGGGQSFDALLGSLDGTGRVTLANGALEGLRADLLPPVLETAAQEGFEPTPEAVLGLVRELSAGARLPLETTSADVSIGAGTLRLAPVAVSLPGAELRAAAAFDLRRGDVASELTLALTPPADEAIADQVPAIGERIAGPWRAPERVASVEALTGYLSALAYRREQERIEALQDDLRETVRLRREARVYRERERVRAALRDDRLAREAETRAEAERAERQRLEEEEARRRQAAEAERAARAAEQARERDEAARRAAAQAAASAPATPPPTPRSDPTPSFEIGPIAPERPASGFGGLPGVGDPNRF